MLSGKTLWKRCGEGTRLVEKSVEKAVENTGIRTARCSSYPSCFFNNIFFFFFYSYGVDFEDLTRF